MKKSNVIATGIIMSALFAGAYRIQQQVSGERLLDRSIASLVVPKLGEVKSLGSGGGGAGGGGSGGSGGGGGSGGSPIGCVTNASTSIVMGTINTNDYVYPNAPAIGNNVVLGNAVSDSTNIAVDNYDVNCGTKMGTVLNTTVVGGPAVSKTYPGGGPATVSLAIDTATWNISSCSFCTTATKSSVSPVVLTWSPHGETWWAYDPYLDSLNKTFGPTVGSKIINQFLLSYNSGNNWVLSISCHGSSAITIWTGYKHYGDDPRGTYQQYTESAYQCTLSPSVPTITVN